jgi:hypothetical protein
VFDGPCHEGESSRGERLLTDWNMPFSKGPGAGDHVDPW